MGSDAGSRSRPGSPPTHSVWAIRNGHLSPAQAETERRLAAVLENREGQAGILRHLAGRAVVAVEAAATYVQAEVEAGTDLSEIAIFKAMPALVNSAVRAVLACRDLAPEDPGADAEVQRIHAKLGVTNAAAE